MRQLWDEGDEHVAQLHVSWNALNLNFRDSGTGWLGSVGLISVEDLGALGKMRQQCGRTMKATGTRFQAMPGACGFSKTPAGRGLWKV